MPWHDSRSMKSLRHIHVLCALGVAVTLTACTQFPQLDETTSAQVRAAPYPNLVPAEDLRAGLPEQSIIDETTTGFQLRVAALRARAARLRRTVIDQTSRSRLETKITIDVPQE